MDTFINKWFWLKSNTLSRIQFLINILVIYALYIPLMLLDFDRANPPIWLLAIGFILGLYMLFVILKRAKDCTKELKFWHILLIFVPIVKWILLISLFFLPTKNK